jgi:hypothetical protein
MFNAGNVISFSYRQPVNGSAGRFGRVLSVRDTEVERVGRFSPYRANDEKFRRSQLLVTLEHANGERKAYYIERANALITYPSLVGRVAFGVAKFVRKFV